MPCISKLVLSRELLKQECVSTYANRTIIFLLKKRGSENLREGILHTRALETQVVILDTMIYVRAAHVVGMVARALSPLLFDCGYRVQCHLTISYQLAYRVDKGNFGLLRICEWRGHRSIEPCVDSSRSPLTLSGGVPSSSFNFTKLSDDGVECGRYGRTDFVHAGA